LTDGRECKDEKEKEKSEKKRKKDGSEKAGDRLA